MGWGGVWEEDMEWRAFFLSLHVGGRWYASSECGKGCFRGWLCRGKGGGAADLAGHGWSACSACLHEARLTETVRCAAYVPHLVISFFLSFSLSFFLQEAYRTCESRMGQELLRRHVLKVLRVWRGWFIFGDDFLNGLQVGGGLWFVGPELVVDGGCCRVVGDVAGLKVVRGR